MDLHHEFNYYLTVTINHSTFYLFLIIFYRVKIIVKYFFFFEYTDLILEITMFSLFVYYCLS